MFEHTSSFHHHTFCLLEVISSSLFSLHLFFPFFLPQEVWKRINIYILYSYLLAQEVLQLLLNSESAQRDA